MQLRRLNKEQTKKQLFDAFVYDKNVNKEDLSARADDIKECQKALKIIEVYKNIIKTNKKKIICFAYEQDKTFKKFKEDKKFKNLVEQFKINKSTTIFKINIVKIVEKYQKKLTSSVTLNFLKSYYKDIKSICKKNPKLFS